MTFCPRHPANEEFVLVPEETQQRWVTEDPAYTAFPVEKFRLLVCKSCVDSEDEEKHVMTVITILRDQQREAQEATEIMARLHEALKTQWTEREQPVSIIFDTVLGEEKGRKP